jgi:tyrosinase
VEADTGTGHSHTEPHTHQLPPRAPVATRQRRSVTQLLPRQLEALRAAWARMLELRDDRGYQFFAGIHGLPLPKYCRIAHGQPFFLPWHRAYLYTFELALRDTEEVPYSTLPWWDWRTVRGIPPQYEADGVPGGNPLASVRINDVAIEEGLRDPDERDAQTLARTPDTFREPGRPGSRPLPTAEVVEEILSRGDYFYFQEGIEQIHGDVHVWVGGHMRTIAFSAYDPIFWAHHTMIDRIWRIWQMRHPQPPLPDRYLNTVMPPFSMTVRQTMDVIALGYDYAVTTSHDPSRG